MSLQASFRRQEVVWSRSSEGLRPSWMCESDFGDPQVLPCKIFLHRKKKESHLLHRRKLLEKVIPLVIDNDKRREVFHGDLAHCLHAQFLKLNHLHILY